MPNKNFLLYTGLMDKVFGVRYENHYLYSRGFFGLGQNDQAHGRTGTHQNDKWEITGQYFLGNLHIDEDTEQSGPSLKLVWKPNSYSRFGGSFLTSSSPYREQMMYSFHFLYGLGHGASITGEIGQAHHDFPK